jgi:alpha-glucoside transport system substrate-binding protein
LALIAWRPGASSSPAVPSSLRSAIVSPCRRVLRPAALLLSAGLLLGCTPQPGPDQPATGQPATGGQAASAQASAPSGEVIRVLGSWEDRELETLRRVVAPFEERTGHTVRFTTTRDLPAALEASIAAGHPPAIAGLPGPGYLAELARKGHIVDLASVMDLGAYKRQTAPAFVHLGTVDGRVMGVFLKGTVKGLLWYNPDVYTRGAFSAWTGLQHAAMSTEGVRPWCMGLESAESSGWPGTDWIEDFVLRQSGPQVYDEWVAGRVRWSAPEIRWAFQSYGTLVGESDVAGGVEGALNTHFSRAGDGLFSDPPACLFVHQGTFMSTFLDESAEASGGRYEMMPFPDIDPRFHGALIGAGDLIALLQDTPGSRELMSYLMGTEAQAILVADGGALSGNILLQDYPNELLERQARLLAEASIFRFDASDAMPEAMSRAFWKAVLDFTADQSRLDAILAGLDAVQAEAYARG